MGRLLLLLLLLALFASACATARQQGVSATVEKAGTGSGKASSRVWQEGFASYYADSLHGNLTANGERYDRNAATCAHRTHPFGTELVVELAETGRRVTCRVNDRGPFVKGRIVDLSRRLATELGMIERGVARVRIAPAAAVR